MKTKSKVLVFTIIILASVFVVFDVFKSENVHDDAFDINCVNNIEYQSENIDVDNNTVFVYATLNDNSSEYDTDEFVICVGQVEGILKNKYRLYSYRGIPENYISTPDLRYIVDFPEYSLKSGSSYYGSVFVGIAPLDCKSINIDGAEAYLKRMTFDINGTKVDFYLYYCVVEQDKYSDHADVIYTNNNGKQFKIEAVDGKKYSKLIEIEKNTVDGSLC